MPHDLKPPQGLRATLFALLGAFAVTAAIYTVILVGNWLKAL